MDYDFALAWRSISMYKQDNLRHQPLSGRNLAGNCDQYCCGRLGGKSSFWIGPLWTVTKLRLGCFCSLNSRKILFQQQSDRVCGIVDAIGIGGVVNKLQSRQLLKHWFQTAFELSVVLARFLPQSLNSLPVVSSNQKNSSFGMHVTIPSAKEGARGR